MSRRAFLKISAAFGAAAFSRRGPTLAPAIASTLSLPSPHVYFPNPDHLLLSGRAAFDLLLVPAYVAVELIRQGGLREVYAGPPGRAHDPDGAFTIPYLSAVAGLVHRGQPPGSLAALWGADALWPDSARLGIGAALLRRGYPFNDAHPGHLAQVEGDLLALRPRLAADPIAGVRAGQASLGLALITAAPQGLAVTFPVEGSAWVEYDWAIPRNARNPQAALDFVAHWPLSHLPPPISHLQAPLTPLTPLPAAARAQRNEIWARVRHAAR